MAFMTKDWSGTETYPIDRFHHVEFYVGNAKQASYFYRTALGFESYAYAGPETGQMDAVSYVLKQNKIFIILTTPLKSRHPATDWLAQHGDSVRDIAFQVEDPFKAHQTFIKQGGVDAFAPHALQDAQGRVQLAGIQTYGGTIHTLINRSQYRGIWAPGFVELKLPKMQIGQSPDLVQMDHIVGNVRLGEMNHWVQYYEKVFGFMSFVEFDETDISTQFSALKSKVVRSKNWNIKMPINEPARGLKKSQIDEFVEFHEGQGVQHIALQSNHIERSIEVLRSRGVEFLKIPDTYYHDLAHRVGTIDEEIEKLRQLNILVDRDEQGYLLQLFTKPIEDRPTFFFEIIQRKGALGFGQGNFQALFESIEREQAQRGNL
jgi:4-hydroxyphenylpyruvate dioxygenase